MYDLHVVDFEAPPVTEVALSIQTEPVPGLTTAHFGVFWNDFLRSMYPIVQEQPPIFAAPEFDGNANIAPQIIFGPASLSRHWYLSNDQTRLVQLQQDRLVVNWRRLRPEQEYPRYVILRDELVRIQKAWASFRSADGFPVSNALGVEVTYINQIGRTLADKAVPSSNILAPQIGFKWPSQLGNLADLQFTQRFQLEGALERASLTISLAPAANWLGQQVHGLALVFRAPGSGTLEDFVTLMDLGHNQIVNGFADIMSPDFRQAWGEHSNGNG